MIADTDHPPADNEAALAHALARATTRLTSQRTTDGHYEGFSDAGVAFDAANLILSRFVAEAWPEPTERVAAKLQHLLSGQHESGLFLLYPEGPCSIQATKVVLLAIDRALESNGAQLSESFRAALHEASARARRAIVHPPEHFELLYLYCFRWMIEALDANAASPERFAPTLNLMVLAPVMLVGLLPSRSWRRVDRILYPFIAVLPQLVSLAAWRAFETSRIGAFLTRGLDRSPSAIRDWKMRVGKHALRWLLDRQDLTGGFYYSPLYTYLFVAAVRDAIALADTEHLEQEGNAAIARALAYIRVRETTVPTGIATSFVASDVWDTSAVATSLLECPKGLISPMDSPEKLAEYALDHQSPSGGFSYGRGSHYPDVDTTGLVLGLFAVVLAKRPNATNRDALLAAMLRAFDFLEIHRSPQGGFNAWTVRHGTDAPPVSPNLVSLLFDVSSADVTARVAVSLGRFLDLAASSSTIATEIGAHRIEHARRMRKLALAYLLSTRNGSYGLWSARWSLGFVIGTRFVLDALATYPEIAGEIDALTDAASRTLLQAQNADGGFGESPDSDLRGSFSPSHQSCAFVTAAAYGILSASKKVGAKRAAARALAYLLATQDADGGWREFSLCTQFSGLYASYALMTQVAITTTLFRAHERDSEL